MTQQYKNATPNRYNQPMGYDKPAQQPIKVSKLPKYKKELMEEISKKVTHMLKDIFPHLTDWDYTYAKYIYSHPSHLQVDFNDKLKVTLVTSGDFPRIEAINDVIYPADKPNIKYDNMAYINSRLAQLTKNTYKGNGIYATMIHFCVGVDALRVVASDGTRYHLK